MGYFFDEETFDEPGMNYSGGSLKGPGVFALIGCEPIKHLSAELALHYRMPQAGSSEIAVSLLVNVLGY